MLILWTSAQELLGLTSVSRNMDGSSTPLQPPGFSVASDSAIIQVRFSQGS
jgi:hypothetical protein